MSTKSDMRTHCALQVDLFADFPFAFMSECHQCHCEKSGSRSEPKSVRSRVSLANQTLNQPPDSLLSNSVAVRHAPLTAMESPIWQSLRIGAASEIVRVQPSGFSSIDDTVPRCSIYRAISRGRIPCVGPHQPCEHCQRLYSLYL